MQGIAANQRFENVGDFVDAFWRPTVAVAAGLSAAVITNQVLSPILFLVHAVISFEIILRLNRIDDSLTSWQITGTAWGIGVMVFLVADSSAIFTVLLTPTLLFPALLYSGIQYRDTEHGQELNRRNQLSNFSLEIDPEELPDRAGARIFGSLIVILSIFLLVITALFLTESGEPPFAIAFAMFGGYFLGLFTVYYSFRGDSDNFTQFRSVKLLLLVPVTGLATFFTSVGGGFLFSLFGLLALFLGLFYPAIIGIWSLTSTSIREKMKHYLINKLSDSSKDQNENSESEESLAGGK